jgi:S1-C subfamily serine protease
MEPGDTERPRGVSPPRRFRTRIALVALIVVALATVAAGLALARPHSTAIGTGFVVIDTNLAYQGEQAAGTGVVLTSSGEVLTNNHVIRGATTIKVVVPATGRSYTASVVGYDVSEDVALLQASGASNLKTASLGNSSTVKLDVGQAVTAVGNAGGTGRLTSASGTVTGLARAITVNNDQGGSERLTGLIETNAAVRPGDSGGPLLNAGGQVVGMDTAASVGYGGQQSATHHGYAIPITKALSIAEQIQSGDVSATVHVGGTAFLGVEVAANSYEGSGAVVASVVPGSPAEAAGLIPDDLITSFGGHAISSPAGLTAIVMTQQPGTPISATYVDQTGAAQTTTVTLASGPPQ